jgi:hypothetical protein
MGRKGAPLSPQGRDKRRSWGFWLVVWGVHCGTTVGGHRFARVRPKAAVSAQIFPILESFFILLENFPFEILRVGSLGQPAKCRAPAKRSRRKLCIFLVLQMPAKNRSASTRHTVPSRNRTIAKNAATRNRRQPILRAGNCLLRRVCQAAAPPLFSRARISWPSRFRYL